MIPRDSRTRAQQQHDALASALSVAASSGLLPTIGGAAPTLIVSVREEDAERGKGYAHAQGCDLPLGMAAALHVGCAGAIQRITPATTDASSGSASKSASSTGTSAARSPSATAAASSPAAASPPDGVKSITFSSTSTADPRTPTTGCCSAGFITDSSTSCGWKIRMNHGVPEVQAPSWCDATLRWRPITTSKTRLQDAVLKR